MEKMHTSFGDWYRTAKITPDGEVLTKRWAGIDSFEPNSDSILDLTKVFFAIGKPSEKFLTDFRAAFQKTDAAFPAKDNDAELRVLAGAELVDCWDTYDARWASYAALSAVCASCRGQRQPGVPEILELSVQKLGERCVSRYTPSDNGKAANLGPEVQAAFKAHCEKGTVPELATPLVSMMQEIIWLRTAHINHQQQLTLQFEETNMLWWLLGEHSRDKEQRLADLSGGAACLTVGKDLSDLVRVAPGPLAAVAFLDRILRFTKAKPDAPVRITEAVNAIAPEQREEWLATSRWDDKLADACPIHHALRLSLASPKKDAWVPAFEQGTSLPKDVALTARELAYQMYLEGVLHKAWQSVVKSA